MSGPRLALWQGAGVAGDLAATLAEAARVAEEAGRAGADLLVFPEGFLTGYHLPGLAPEALRGVEGALAELRGVAKTAGVDVVMGTHLATPEGLANAAVVVDRAGVERGRYVKRAMFGAWERATFVPGRSGLVVELGGLRVGVAICYDVEFPELIRADARAGADLVVVPTALMEPHGAVARLIPPARALENQIFVAYANRVGAEAGLTYTGLSCICGPGGEMLAQAGVEPALLIAELDRARIAAARAEACYLDDLARLEAGPGRR